MSSIPPPPTGIYPPCVTFMNEDESIDLDSITSHVLRLAKGGVTGLVLQGSNGEAVHLNHSERSIIIKHVRKCLDDNGYEDTPIIAGCGAASSHETLLLAREAGEAGASYALILPPSYWAGAMNKTVLASYFKDIADKSSIPILLYNFPLVANGVSLDSDTMIELAQHDKIVGVKLTCGNIGNLHRVAAHTDRSTFAVMSGKSEFAMHGFVGGASACIAALVNLFPKTHVALIEALNSNNLVDAKAIQDLLSDGDLAQSRLGIGGLKQAVKEFYGYGSGKALQKVFEYEESL